MNGQSKLDKPILRLAPHEIPPLRRRDLDDEPFVFRAPWNEGERDFIGQVVGQNYVQMIFFALSDEPERGNFVNAPMRVSKNPNRPAPPIFEPRTYFRQEDAKGILESTINNGWGRLYFLDEHLNLAQTETVRWRLFLAQSGWGEWSKAPDFYEHSARFRWNTDGNKARQMASLPPLELLELVRASLLEPRGDAVLAREFAVLRGFPRHKLCLPTTRGDYEQWKQLLHWYLQSHFPTKAQGKARLKIDLRNPRQNSIDKWLIGGACSVFGPDATRFCDWTRHYFAPQLDTEYLKRCSAAAHWSNRTLTLGVGATSPTQHERLEALLQLRDWLADKATPAEIEALLRAD